jgi:hypothetical protein
MSKKLFTYNHDMQEYMIVIQIQNWNQRYNKKLFDKYGINTISLPKLTLIYSWLITTRKL